MSEKPVAVLGMTIEPQESGVSADITPLTAPSTVVWADNKPVYFGPIECKIENAEGGGAQQNGSANCTLLPTSVKVKSGLLFVLREGDLAATVAVPAQIPGTPPTPTTINVTAVITVANQDKVLAK